MSVTSQINRIQSATNMIKNKLVALGLTKASVDGTGSVSSTDTIDVMARAIELVNKKEQSSISSTITEPDGSITIPAGYYDGTVTVSASVPVNYYITGSNEPDNAIGNDGDIYMVI